MMQLAIFTFNPFSENTYVLIGPNKQCAIVDPGMSNEEEQDQLFQFIEKEGLTPVLLLNTHCHIDHVLGNAAVKRKYNVPFQMHRDDMPTLELASAASLRWNVPFEGSPLPDSFLEEGNKVVFDEVELRVLHVPGHAPGHIVFVNDADNVAIAGDVLFKESVGRTDLPGGNGPMLAKMIQEKMYNLPEDMVVFPGHGPETTIGWEKEHNPFVRPGMSAFV